MKKSTIIFAVSAAATLAATLLFAPIARSASAQLRFGFDSPPSGQSDPGPWTAGCFSNAATTNEPGCIVTAVGGALTRADRPTGSTSSPAVKFPETDGSGTAIIRVQSADNLNPGTADFTISAIVRLTADEVSDGANLVQKGLNNTPGGQWKLQVDRGRPGCKLIGTDRGGRRVSAIVWWPTTVADAGWLYLTCRRRGDTLSIGVGDAPPVYSADYAGMYISNTADVTIGAKGTGTNNDQFHGALDNVGISMST